MSGAGSKGWAAFSTVGLAGWVAAILVVGARAPADETAAATTDAAVAGGAVFFSLMFAAIAWRMRRSGRRSRHDLFERLAIVPIAPDELRRTRRPLYTIGYVYVALGAIVTAAGLAGVALGGGGGGGDGDRARRWILIGMTALIALWAVFGAYALVRTIATATAVVRPLGLELTEMPRYASSLGDLRSLDGATSYAGTRHGRPVTISQTTSVAVTEVGLAAGSAAVAVPRDAMAMAGLTGEGVMSWRGVEVRHADGAVVVIRRRNGAGGWFLHDLLLAEAVASGSVRPGRTSPATAP